MLGSRIFAGPEAWALPGEAGLGALLLLTHCRSPRSDLEHRTIAVVAALLASATVWMWMRHHERSHVHGCCYWTRRWHQRSRLSTRCRSSRAAALAAPRPRSHRPRLAAVAVGAIAGSYSVLLNLRILTGHVLGNLPDRNGASDPSTSKPTSSRLSASPRIFSTSPVLLARHMCTRSLRSGFDRTGPRSPTEGRPNHRHRGSDRWRGALSCLLFVAVGGNLWWRATERAIDLIDSSQPAATSGVNRLKRQLLVVRPARSRTLAHRACLLPPSRSARFQETPCVGVRSRPICMARRFPLNHLRPLPGPFLYLSHRSLGVALGGPS